ncbi:MoaD/ThiS family protein [Corynebacterium urealyticum]|nr:MULTISPECIES: MoaD/ThiS family protein [Corynebacterium]QQB07950.1 MoaD/ThiS family protein [Corynebacterium urealyticum]QQC41862.1 MoaD/ThiS family protein [Corynebacterium urealyticum]QQE50485.1 MoaD/ThiS family protein [Corynebacterium urealyticum]
MRIHYFAAARAATGVSEETSEGFDTLGELLDDAAARHTGRTDSGLSLADILERCTFLVDGQRAERAFVLDGAQRVDVLPPFAGG